MASMSRVYNSFRKTWPWSKMNNMELHKEKIEVVTYTLNGSKIMRE